MLSGYHDQSERKDLYESLAAEKEQLADYCSHNLQNLVDEMGINLARDVTHFGGSSVLFGPPTMQRLVFDRLPFSPDVVIQTTATDGCGGGVAAVTSAFQSMRDADMAVIQSAESFGAMFQTNNGEPMFEHILRNAFIDATTGKLMVQKEMAVGAALVSVLFGSGVGHSVLVGPKHPQFARLRAQTRGVMPIVSRGFVPSFT